MIVEQTVTTPCSFTELYIWNASFFPIYWITSHIIPSSSSFFISHLVPVARLEYFRALKLSELESFRTLKFSRLENFMTLMLYGQKGIFKDP